MPSINPKFGSVKKVLVLEYLELPFDIQEIVKNFESFGNDRLLRYASCDFGPQGNETWLESFSSPEMNECMNNAQNEGFKGNVLDYISNQEPIFAWLNQVGFDFDVSEIHINISW